VDGKHHGGRFVAVLDADLLLVTGEQPTYID